MSKDEAVGCFYSGSSQADGPDFTITLAAARAWKDEGKGYFCCHGQAFQLVTPISSGERGISSRAAACAFSRVQQKLCKPDPINYPIPAVADHRLRWMFSFMVNEQTKAECY